MLNVNGTYAHTAGDRRGGRTGEHMVPEIHSVGGASIEGCNREYGPTLERVVRECRRKDKVRNGPVKKSKKFHPLVVDKLLKLKEN